ncbi:MAG TPA: TIGR04442 family protein [Desulfuromonadales bacterium]|nr:TIGR04442 family protein [Desulfuromonadales bacterium]
MNPATPQEIRLHGHLNETIEYFAMAMARDVYSRYFFEISDQSLRFFSPGNEFVLHPEGISHRGNGGSFCEYMFGVEQPLSDLAKTDARNRLVLYGAYYRDQSQLEFTGKTEETQSYERVFFDGNAIHNYFFFLTGSVSGPLQEQQESLARLLGKILKQSPHVGLGDDAELLEDIYGLLGHRSAFYLIKLVNKKHKQYHDLFRYLYGTYKSIPELEFEKLLDLAERLGIDKYQQERIRIDVMYKHPDNQRIVDEYKNILIECNRKGSINQLENARLTRLKTLSVRNKIPSALFYALDELLKHDKLVDLEEQDYLAETRQVLEGIFFADAQIDVSITPEDMALLLHAKRQASENRDHTFEHILLETGKACDEKIHEGGDISLLENFSYIVTFFDRYDNASAIINELAFMENSRFGEEHVRSLLGSKKAFCELRKSLWNDLFIAPVLENKYLGQYGRKKLLGLNKGLEAIEEGRLTVNDLLEQIHAISGEERLYELLLAHVKERIRNFYSRYNTHAEQEALLEEVGAELRSKRVYERDIPPALFRNVVVNIKKEAIYLHNLLPGIIAERDVALREDFLDNSGLDRFYVEELEREYFELNNLDMDDLYLIRKGYAA